MERPPEPAEFASVRRADPAEAPASCSTACNLENNVEGLFIDSTFTGTGNGAHVIVRDSVLSGNAGNGIRALTQAGKPPAFAVVERSSMVNSGQAGILADGPGATLLLNDSTIARNNVGINTVNGGQLISYRNNRINNNIGPDG